MNDILFNILQEEDRQRVVLSDLVSLLQKNPEVFGNPHINPVTLNNIISNSSNAVAFQQQQPGQKQRINSTNNNTNNNINNNNSNRKVEPAPTPSNIVTVTNIEYADASIQVDEKDTFSVVDDSTSTMSFKDRTRGDKPPPRPSTFSIKGADIPYQLRKLMSSFPTVLRIPPQGWTSQLIMSLYLDKIRRDDALPPNSSLRLVTMSTYTYNYFNRIFGLNTISDTQTVQLIRACEHHSSTNKRVLLFAKQIGISDPESPPEFDVRDTEFILSVVRILKGIGELQPKLEADLQQPFSYTHHNFVNAGLPSFLLKSIAISLTTPLFGKWVYDRGEEFVRRVQSIPASTRGPKYISVDDFMEVRKQGL